MTAPAVAAVTYKKLVAKTPPKIVRTEEQNEQYVKVLFDLTSRKMTKEESEFADLLTLLIEDFEEKNYALPKASPTDAIMFLMDQHDLKQKDLIDVFGAPSIVSEVLSGKRDLNKDHIARLSKRFHVSPELFFQIADTGLPRDLYRNRKGPV
jgi:HTH-type transcriptional regulator/antitoxin HigA